ncbi:MAG: hypothetical protein E7449_05535 [Ruminococcaceae bacterium]|nr:hypothetical protein [Oscillospiraceae bacterium]
MKVIASLLVLQLLLAAFGLFPFSGEKIADLQPVQVLTVQQLPGAVLLRTDNGLSGYGADYAEAMERLEKTAPGKAFFACCSAVVLCGGEESLSAVVQDARLRPAAAVYRAPFAPDAAQLQPVLAAHPGGVRIADLQRGGESLPQLIPLEEGWLVEDGA